MISPYVQCLYFALSSLSETCHETVEINVKARCYQCALASVPILSDISGSLSFFTSLSLCSNKHYSYWCLYHRTCCNLQRRNVTPVLLVSIPKRQVAIISWGCTPAVLWNFIQSYIGVYKKNTTLLNTKIDLFFSAQEYWKVWKIVCQSFLSILCAKMGKQTWNLKNVQNPKNDRLGPPQEKNKIIKLCLVFILVLVRHILFSNMFT